MPYSNYDAWLERPHQDSLEASERFYDWCEEHNISPDDPNAETVYQDWIESQFEEPDYEDEFETDEFYE